MRARARVCVCVCVCVRARGIQYYDYRIIIYEVLMVGSVMLNQHKYFQTAQGTTHRLVKERQHALFVLSATNCKDCTFEAAHDWITLKLGFVLREMIEDNLRAYRVACVYPEGYLVLEGWLVWVTVAFGNSPLG